MGAFHLPSIWIAEWCNRYLPTNAYTHSESSRVNDHVASHLGQYGYTCRLGMDLVSACHAPPSDTEIRCLGAARAPLCPCILRSSRQCDW